MADDSCDVFIDHAAVAPRTLSWPVRAGLLARRRRANGMSSSETDTWLRARYEAVFLKIKQDITEGRLSPGTRLPGERKMAETMTASRETIREALRMCEQEGLILRIPTRGTFVAPPRVDQDLGHMDAFDSTVRQLRLSPAYQLLAAIPSQADGFAAHRLRVAVGDPVMRVTALGMGSELPLAVYESILPRRVFERLPTDPSWAEKATYQITAAAIGATALTVEQEFDAVALPREIAQLLRVSAKTPGFKALSVFSHDGEPLELRTAWYPGSRYRFRVTRKIDLESTR